MTFLRGAGGTTVWFSRAKPVLWQRFWFRMVKVSYLRHIGAREVRLVVTNVDWLHHSAFDLVSF